MKNMKYLDGYNEKKKKSDSEKKQRSSPSKHTEFEISVLVKNMASGKKITLDIDHKAEYYNYLEKKHE